MLNHIVYDVFIKGEDDFKDEKTGLRGMSRFGDGPAALKEFSKKGLKFRYAVRTWYLRGTYYTTQAITRGRVRCLKV